MRWAWGNRTESVEMGRFMGRLRRHVYKGCGSDFSILTCFFLSSSSIPSFPLSLKNIWMFFISAQNPATVGGGSGGGWPAGAAAPPRGNPIFFSSSFSTIYFFFLLLFFYSFLKKRTYKKTKSETKRERMRVYPFVLWSDLDQYGLVFGSRDVSAGELWTSGLMLSNCCDLWVIETLLWLACEKSVFRWTSGCRFYVFLWIFPCVFLAVLQVYL